MPAAMNSTIKTDDRWLLPEHREYMKKWRWPLRDPRLRRPRQVRGVELLTKLFTITEKALTRHFQQEKALLGSAGDGAERADPWCEAAANKCESETYARNEVD